MILLFFGNLQGRLKEGEELLKDIRRDKLDINKELIFVKNVKGIFAFSTVGNVNIFELILTYCLFIDNIKVFLIDINPTIFPELKDPRVLNLALSFL